MNRKRFCLAVSIALLTLLLAGCDYVNVAIMNVSNNRDGKISRSSYFWSGISDGIITIREEDPKDITFDIDMTEGNLTLVLTDGDGEEVYTLSEEGEYLGTAEYTVEKAGKYKLVQKGKKFNGSYEVTWGAKVEEETTESAK